jgi:hypothetical protein
LIERINWEINEQFDEENNRQVNQERKNEKTKGRKEEKVMEKIGKAGNHSMGRGAGGGSCQGNES